jgi:hypothetical protein
MSAVEPKCLIELFCSICDTTLSDDDVSSDVCGTCGAPILEPIQNVTIYAEPFTLSGDLG